MISQQKLRELLDYDANTGVFRWREFRYGSRGEGQIAGGKSETGAYWKLCIQGRAYRAHRLAWLYVHGVWPDGVVDHINRDGLDNRIANLRIATKSQNMSNGGFNSRNTSGYRGVSRDRKSNKWRATISVRGRYMSLGNFATPQEAAAAHARVAKKEFGEFFHSNKQTP